MDGKYLHDTGVELVKLVKATLNAYRKFSNSAIKDDNIMRYGDYNHIKILSSEEYRQ